MIAKKIQKVLSVLITLCLLAVSVIHVFAGADVPTPQEPTNIIAGNANASAVSATGARAIDNVDEKYATIANSSITAANAAKLTDGITSDGKPTSGADAGTVMVPIAGLGGNSYGGVVYNLGKYYDISEVTTWTINSQKSHVVTEITVFAAKKEEDLYKPASRIGIAALEDAQVPATDAETAEISLSLSEAVTAQYVAIFISNQKGDVAYYSRVTEMEIFGTLSAEQPDLNLFLPDNNLTGKQIVATGIKATDDTFATIQSADYPAAGVYTNLTDGNTSNASDMYGGIPDGGTQIRGVLFDLKGYYDISKISAVLWNAQTGIMVKDVYAFASETLDDLYQSSNQMLTSIGSTDKVRSVEINPVKKVRYVAFFFHAPGSYPRVCELEVYGKARPADEQPAPPPPNILTTEQGIGDPMPYYDPAGKFISAFSIPSYPADDSDPNSEHLPTFASVIKGHSLDGFTDGNTGQSVQIYGGMPDNQTQKGRPVVIYDLGAYYDITGAAMYVGNMIQRVRIYASGSMEKITYYDNLIYVDQEDSTETYRSVALDAPKKVRYVAFCLAKSSGGWQAMEFEVYGSRSADQATAPVESDDPKYPTDGGEEAPTESDNLLFGSEPDEAGLAGKDSTGVYDYNTLSNIGGNTDTATGKLWSAMLTDGIITDSEGFYQNAQLWANDKATATSGGRYVLVYDLGAYYDLNKAAVYATPAPGTQLLKAWEVYAGNDIYTLFQTDNRLGGLEVVEGKNTAEDVTISITASSVRYIAYVFSQVDTEYGAARITEIEAYGTKVGDLEENNKEDDGYVEFTDDATGVTAWVFFLEDETELPFDGTLKITEVTDEALAQTVYMGLDRRYKSEKAYQLLIEDEFGTEVDLEGREMRVFIPVSEEMSQKKDLNMAWIDGDIVELLNGSFMDDQYVFETTSYLTYAFVSRNAAIGDWIWGDGDIPSTAAAVSILTVVLFAVSITLVVASKKKTYKFVRKF